MRLGLIGARFGYHHVHTLLTLPGAELVAVADRSADLSYLAQYGVKTYRDGLELLRHEALDGVSLCVSPQARPELIAAAADRGVPLFIEKPFAATVEDARRLERLCREAGATVMLGFSFRFHPAFVRLQELVRGELGRGWLLSGEYVFDWLPPPTAWLWDPANGNGFFNENSCHLFDAVCNLLGEPLSVGAEGATFRGSPSEEVAALSVRFAGGAVASLAVGGLGAGAFSGFPRLNFVTEHGQAELLGRDHMWETLRWAGRGQRELRTFSASPETLGRTRYSDAFAHFIGAVQAGTPPAATVQDGVRAVALAEAVYRAIRTGQKVEVER